MKHVAVFLDAGYFWVQLCQVILGKYHIRNEVEINYEALRHLLRLELEKLFGPNSDLLRAYWYDGPGPQGKTAEHHLIDKLDDFKLRLGTRNSAGIQKGVDGLIIADLVSLAQQRAITHALLVTGDSDIAPGVVAAQSMGLRVHLLSIGSQVATSPYLAAEVDLKRSWGASEVSQFAITKEPLTSSNLVSDHRADHATIPQATIESLARAAKDQATRELKSDLIMPASSAQTAILPRKLDSLLLTIARRHVGRSLSEPEKRSLREAFKKLL